MTLSTKDRPIPITRSPKPRRPLSDTSPAGVVPVGAFNAPVKGTDPDHLEAERDGMIESAIQLAAAAIDNDPEVNALQGELHRLADRVRKILEVGPVTDGSDDHLWLDIDDMAQNLPLQAAYCMARAWLWDRGSIPLDRQALTDYYNR